MENSKNKVEALQGNPNASNQSSTGADSDEKLVDQLQSQSSFEDRQVDEHRYHHHHDSLDIARLDNSFSASRLQFKGLIHERDGLRRINDSCNQELLLCKNHNKQLTVENDKLKDEIIALRERIDESVVQSDNFNEDSLLEIFSYLSMDDMMQVKRVCKKWYQVSQQWFKQVQTLVYQVVEHKISDARVQLYENYYKRKVYEKKDIYGFDDIITILHSCGHHIKYFKAEIFKSRRSLPEERKKFIFQWVPQLCKNIVDVEFNGAGLCGDPMKLNCEFMAKHWEKLEKIVIKYSNRTVEEDFLILLRNNNELKTLKLKFDCNYHSLINDNFFTCLPRTITKINIRNIEFNGTQQLKNFIFASKNFTSLQSLELADFKLSDVMARAIANITSLVHLSLNYVPRYESPGTINQIANLKSLKSLYLVSNLYLHEDNIINIVANCMELEKLRILGGGKLTDRGLAVIAKLKKLKCLETNFSDVTVESTINFCYWLEVLCLHHSKMNNRDAIKLLKRASNLRYVDFILCDNVTKDIIQEANKIANERKNNILVVQAFSCRFNSEGGAFSDGNPEEIDNLYFKYSKNRKKPLRIFPNDIENFITDCCK